jgi:hypothetical protein
MLQVTENVQGDLVELKDAYKILIGKPEGKRHLSRLGIGGRIILKSIVGKWMGRCGQNASGSG